MGCALAGYAAGWGTPRLFPRDPHGGTGPRRPATPHAKPLVATGTTAPLRASVQVVGAKGEGGGAHGGSVGGARGSPVYGGGPVGVRAANARTFRHGGGWDRPLVRDVQGGGGAGPLQRTARHGG